MFIIGKIIYDREPNFTQIQIQIQMRFIKKGNLHSISQ